MKCGFGNVYNICKCCVRVTGSDVRLRGGVYIRGNSPSKPASNKSRGLRTFNGKVVTSGGRGDRSKSKLYPGGIRSIGYGVSWDLIDGETMLGLPNSMGLPRAAWPAGITPEDVRIHTYHKTYFITRTSIPTPTPIPETEPAPFEHTFEEPSPVHQHLSLPQEQAHEQMTMDDLLQVVPQLISRIDSLETDLKQTKLAMGNTLVKLVKQVKKLEGFLKRRNMVLSDSEEEEPEAQGRKSQDDHLASLVQGLVTPSMTKVNASGEEQVEDITPNTLEAAKTITPRNLDHAKRRADVLGLEDCVNRSLSLRLERCNCPIVELPVLLSTVNERSEPAL
ncbi:hypothetical protein Tco_0576751 [Tanacetum coccineum]